MRPDVDHVSSSQGESGILGCEEIAVESIKDSTELYDMGRVTNLTRLQALQWDNGYECQDKTSQYIYILSCQSIKQIRQEVKIMPVMCVFLCKYVEKETQTHLTFQ